MISIRADIGQAKELLGELARERDPLLAEFDRVTVDVEQIGEKLKTKVGVAASLQLSRQQSGASELASNLRMRLIELDKRAHAVVASTNVCGAPSTRCSDEEREERRSKCRDLWATYRGGFAGHPWYARHQARGE